MNYYNHITSFKKTSSSVIKTLLKTTIFINAEKYIKKKKKDTHSISFIHFLLHFVGYSFTNYHKIIPLTKNIFFDYRRIVHPFVYNVRKMTCTYLEFSNFSIIFFVFILFFSPIINARFLFVRSANIERAMHNCFVVIQVFVSHFGQGLRLNLILFDRD